METNQVEVVKPRVSPGDFFLHLGIMVALYISSISLIALLFEVINKAYPDVLNDYAYYSSNAERSGIMLSMAFVLIMFPLYIILGWLFNRQLVTTPEKKYLSIRKWLTYFTLFVTGLACAIDLAIVLYYFLNGEISVRFILKALTVLVVAGIIFAYYLIDARQDAAQHKKLFKGFGSAALILVIGSIVWAFMVVGSPVNQRKARLDERRVSDLTTIQWQVSSYWQRNGVLPENLAALHDSLGSFALPADPETKAAYEYRKTASTTFELCATFATKATDTYQSRPIAVDDVYVQNATWNHEAGHTCFSRTIDPKLYPVEPKAPMMNM